MLKNNIEQIEIDLIIKGIHARWGYNFTHYSQASLRRRLEYMREEAGFSRLTELLDRVLHDEDFFDFFLRSMSITVTEMFRDPPFYLALREKVIPLLKTFPFIKIWHAGCATGEEVYSMAILLHEENFLDRARIYATDFNKNSLAIAEKGVYPIAKMTEYNNNYQKTHSSKQLSSYYSSAYDLAKIKDFLKERITFSYHNLVTDGVFGEMNLIICRNVLIYFDKILQNRVLNLFTESLRYGGFLCLGSKESLNFTDVNKKYSPIESRQKIYRKIEVSHV
ncbi:MAG: protein-glutamate O-methyltransferase CheR [Legionellales bacterium]|nr:protein-glutamate O-methyltransferase CheR [Legionellales bacterium]